MNQIGEVFLGRLAKVIYPNKLSKKETKKSFKKKSPKEKKLVAKASKTKPKVKKVSKK